MSTPIHFPWYCKRCGRDGIIEVDYKDTVEVLMDKLMKIHSNVCIHFPKLGEV